VRLPAGFATTVATATAVAATVTATATTTASTEAIAAATAAALFAGPGFVHIQCAAVQLISIQRAHCTGRLVGIRHLHECEATGLLRIAIANNANALNCTVLAKRLFQLIFRGLVGKVSYEDIGHFSKLLIESLAS
jgi:hypothetical protein